MKKIFLSLLICLLFLSGCGSKQRYSGLCYDCGFNTNWNWIYYARNEKENANYYQLIRDLTKKYNSLFDIYNDYQGINNIKTINDNAGIKPVVVEPEIIEMLELAKKVYELSDGHFDITQGALFKIWHDTREEGKALNANGEYGKLPDQEELIAASKHHGFEHIIIDKKASTVYIDDPNISLDVGGIAKGFAVEKVAQALIAQGVDSGSVVGGGNVRTIGIKEDGKPWGVAINDPRNNEDYSYDGIASVFLKADNSVVTSGNYFNYYLIEDGSKMHHIINPDTLYPSDLYESISVITPHSGLADALSTSLFNMSISDGLNFIAKVKTEFNTKVEVLWVLSSSNQEEVETSNVNGLTVYTTEGFSDYTQK